MILKDGTDTKEEVRRPGPYCDGMAVVLSRIVRNGGGDDYAGNEWHGDGCERVGRRLYCWDSQGFLTSMRFDTSDDAITAMIEEYGTVEEDD